MFLMGTLFILLASVAFGQQQAEDPVFRSGVSLVRVDAQVVEGQRVISGLQREDFVVLDEGAPQAVQYFARDSEPLWLVLLLDVSGSMKKRLTEMATVARRALSSLGPEDRVAVLFFGRDVKISQEFTTDLDFAADAIGDSVVERGVGSGTAINSSLITAASYLHKQAESKPGRRAIVILTDNSSLNYQAPDEAVLARLFEADAVLNAIVTPGAKPPAPMRPGIYVNPDFTPSDVFRLAKETGGEVLRAERAGDTFREMIARIRTRYSLHYRAPSGSPDQLRRIEVQLTPQARQKHPRAVVRARSGYRTPG
ncbi:MAG: VWA domain-containing protein [Acidimicrobiia bacterium]|nr:VWA domain-containing protein [Acidimicrobiia bacterium]